MFLGCSCFLIAATTTGFLSEVPPMLEEILEPKTEIVGVFEQTKYAANGKKYVMTGEYIIRHGLDFTWKTLEPFETCFYSNREEYTYTNEDETVTKKLEDLPNSTYFVALGRGDYTVFFDLFDALYKEEDGKFYLKAKPKTRELKKALSRVDAEGTPDNWVLRAEFPNKTIFELKFRNKK